MQVLGFDEAVDEIFAAFGFQRPSLGDVRSIDGEKAKSWVVEVKVRTCLEALLRSQATWTAEQQDARERKRREALVDQTARRARICQPALVDGSLHRLAQLADRVESKENTDPSAVEARKLLVHGLQSGGLQKYVDSPQPQEGPFDSIREKFLAVKQTLCQMRPQDSKSSPALARNSSTADSSADLAKALVFDDMQQIASSPARLLASPGSQGKFPAIVWSSAHGNAPESSNQLPANVQRPSHGPEAYALNARGMP
jgi:hypothetical protein